MNKEFNEHNYTLQNNKAGFYMVKSFNEKCTDPYTSASGGFVTNAGTRNIDFDSFVKAISIKNTKTLDFEKYKIPKTFTTTALKPANFTTPVNTRSNRICNTSLVHDYTNLHFDPNVKNLQNHIYYDHGINSRDR